MDKNLKKIDIVIAAGGTGGHIFPALAVALQLKKERGNISLLWAGTARSREVELCERNNIPLVLLDVTGIERKLSMKAAASALNFIREFLRMRSLFSQNRPAVVMAFGGYVCAPVLAAARILGIPYFIHEQNTVAGLVNRMFAKKARRIFAGLPMLGRKKILERLVITGTPVRNGEENYGSFSYPSGFDKKKKTILICGGSQGAQSMNSNLVEPVKHWIKMGFQVVWQTGKPGYDDVVSAVKSLKPVFVFSSMDDLYPFYAQASIVVGRAGASTLAEVAYFGLPCVVIPLPWATENHQWINAGVVETQGWGVRVKQDDQCGKGVDLAVMRILTDKETSEMMSRKALDNSPASAAADIARSILSEASL